MELTPVKLLKNGPAKRTLLKLKGETTSNIDKKDYLESRMNKLTRARDLMAIEDASEMAKLYLHAGGVFEKIIRALLKESGKKVTFRCLKTSNNTKLPKKKSGLEYIMIEWMPNNGTNFGHYGMARVSHARKTVTVYDSMANSESPFENHFKKVYDGKYKIVTTNKIGRPQPTGGDVKSTQLPLGRCLRFLNTMNFHSIISATLNLSFHSWLTIDLLNLCIKIRGNDFYTSK
jgi:hypothetical protein